MTVPYVPDPSLDLVLDRTVDVPPDLVWLAWTSPAHLTQWFCPRPWTTAECDIDLRPGGRFRTVLAGPDGERNEHLGCYLEVVPEARLVWTTALVPGFRPAPTRDTSGVPHFTAVISIEPHGRGTKYRAVAMHKDPAGRLGHDTMGFQDGWGAAFAQLVEAAATWPRAR